MVITNDSAGNQFIGVDDVNLSTLAIANAEMSQLLDLAIGAGNYALRAGTTKYHVNWRPNIPQEVFTSAVGTVGSDFPASNSPTFYTRFAHPYAINSNSPSSFFSGINTNDTNSATANDIQGATINALFPGASITPSMNCWITANNRSLASYVFNSTTNYRLFIWTGVLSDSVSPYDTYPLGAAAIAIGNDGVGGTVQSIIRVATPNSASAQAILTSGDANYPITCSDAQTPGSDWFTDLFLRDDNAPNNNPTAGRCSNLLLAKSGGLIINETYEVPSNIDGGSLLFKCVVKDFGTDDILMRVSET